jgi:hypothetical protein
MLKQLGFISGVGLYIRHGKSTGRADAHRRKPCIKNDGMDED